MPADALNGVYNTLGTTRCELVALEEKRTFCKVSILDTLKDAQRKRAGFVELLRDNTNGIAQVQSPSQPHIVIVLTLHGSAAASCNYDPCAGI